MPPYTSRDNSPVLLPEERDVQAALAEYITEGATEADWVASYMLYSIYLRWRGEHRWRYDPDHPERLTRRQFGRAIRRVFPDVKRCRRRYHGKQAWGYCGLFGPESTRSHGHAPNDYYHC